MTTEAYDYDAEARRLEAEQQAILDDMQAADAAETARLDREDELDRQAEARVDADNAWMLDQIERMNRDNEDTEGEGQEPRRNNPPRLQHA